VTRPQVRVLLDTGPTEAELDRIRGLFDDLGMDALAEGHSYGGPPPTSAFLIVVNSPLVPFLDRVAGLDGGAGRLERVVGGLQAMRADERRWGRPHGVQLEDSHSGHIVALPAALPTAAYRALLGVDLSGLDRSTPPVLLEWHGVLARWQARLATAPVRLIRRAPLRWREADNPRAREVTEAETGRLWQLAGHDAHSAVTWQRAHVVLCSTLGWNIPSIARQTLMSADRVRAVIRNFNEHGFSSLDLAYGGGEAVKPTPDEEQDAAEVARRPPSDYGLPAERWDPVLLGEFLVGEGLVEDADLGWVRSLLAGARSDS